MKTKKIMISIFAVILIMICVGGAFLAAQNEEYYTQIDNDNVQEIAPHGDMNYK